MNRLVRTAVVSLSLAVVMFAGCDSDDSSSEDVSADSNAGAGQASQTDEQAQQPKQKPKSDESSEDEGPKATTSGSGTLPENPPPKLDQIVELEQLSKAAGGRSLEPTELPGREPSSDYNARRFRPEGSTSYGIGIQVWDFDDASNAQKRLSDLRNQYLDAKEPPSAVKTSLGSGAFTSTRGGIRNLLFSVDRAGDVVALSCSIDVCEQLERVYELAEEVRTNVGDLADRENDETTESAEAVPRSEGDSGGENANDSGGGDD